MQYQKPCIASLAPSLPGHVVVMADGDEFGIVEGVVSTPRDEDADSPEHFLVVKVEQSAPEQEVPQSTVLFIDDDTVHAVTEDAVILGTTTQWVSHHAITEPPGTVQLA
jgi:hypothetical protein